VGHHPGIDIRISLTADVKPAVPNTATIRLDFTFYPQRAVFAYINASTAYFFHTHTILTADHIVNCSFRNY